MANIKYKPLSKELRSMVAPNSSSEFKGRASLGLENSVGEYFYMEVEKLLPFSKQPRSNFDDTEISELADSIKIYGIRQPLTVIRSEEVPQKYEIVSGERRYRAAKLAGLLKVPCIILEDVAKAEEIAIIENIHRADLHPVELGVAYQKLLAGKNWGGQAELAQKLAVSPAAISEHLSYAELDEETRTYLIENNITSRDVLRKLVQHSKEPSKIKEILGISSPSQNKRSILRIYLDQNEFKIQKKALARLEPSEKAKLKLELQSLIKILDA